MRSMTGYGRGQSSKAGITITAEVKTVNHRYLDVNIRLPKSLLALEIPLRQLLQEQFARGRVELNLTQDTAGAHTAMVSANLPLAHEYAQAARQIAQAAGVKDSLKLSSLITLPEVLTLVPLEMGADALMEAASEAVLEACRRAGEDREREGEQLKLFFLDRLSALEDALQKLEQLAAEQPVLALQKLQKRITALQDIQADPQRLAQEAALLADRADIAEEISRLKAHCVHMRQLIQREAPAGRDMDFLAQEFNREANTICSKSASLEVTRLGLICKSEADKMREQIQNVE